MLPEQYSQEQFVFAGTRNVTHEEKQKKCDRVRFMPRRIGGVALLGLVGWPLCFLAVAGLDHLLGHGDRGHNPLRAVLSAPFMLGICVTPVVAFTLASQIRKDWLRAQESLRVEQVEHWDRRPQEELDDRDRATWDLPIWVEVIANTTTIWDEAHDYDEQDKKNEEQPGDGGTPWSGQSSSWKG